MQQTLTILTRLGPGRIIAMGAVTLALLAFFAYVALRVAQPAMGVLYTDLALTEAGSILRELDTRGIRYETRGDGGTILVPKAEIAKVRMDLAAKGLPSGGSVGYEIFDKGDAFSTTSFVQNINHLRALEGELARTIRSVGRVESARVHLVIPERRLFERDREMPRASIALRLRGDLESGQIRAIRHLVASAVEGLKPERVSIVDERGRLLADGARDDASSTGVAAEERQAAIERRLKTQVEEIVAGIVGSDRARIQIATELDLNRVESRSETFDPESRVARSNQTRTETQQTSNPDGAVSVGNELPGAQQPAAGASRDLSSKNEEITNYEISRTTRTETNEGGRIKRLSVAVLVDGIYGRGPNGETTYQPRPQEELDRIAALVRSAVGFDRNRGDQIEVVNLRFAEPPVANVEGTEPSLMQSLLSPTKEDVMRLVELGVLALLSLVVLLTVVRPMMKRAFAPGGPLASAPALPALAMAGAPAAAAIAGSSLPPLPNAEDSHSRYLLDVAKINGEIHAGMLEHVGEMVKGNPHETVAVVRNWLREE